MRFLLVLLAAMFLLPVPVAAAGGGGHSACAGLAYGTRVTMLDNCFNGAAQIVELGTTITVTNRGAVDHTYTAVDGSFDSGTLRTGESARIDVPRAGTFPVYCTLHSSPQGEGMAGLLVVSEDPAEQPRAAAVFPPLAGFGAGLVASVLAIRLGRRAPR